LELTGAFFPVAVLRAAATVVVPLLGAFFLVVLLGAAAVEAGPSIELFALA